MVVRTITQKIRIGKNIKSIPRLTVGWVPRFDSPTNFSKS